MSTKPRNPSRRRVVTALGVGAAGALAAPRLFATARAAGRTVKIGMVSPQTGPIAAFGEADKWVLAEVRKVLAKGITVAGEHHPVEIIYRDSQSSANRASEVASQLINNDQVDIIAASSTGDTTNPVADQCEVAGVPCVTTDDPWEDWFFSRHGIPDKGFQWTYHFFWGFGMLANMYADMWLSLPTNKITGVMFTNDSDGMAANNPKNGMPSVFQKHGLDVIDLGLYPPLSEDFTAQIAQLKKGNCEVCCGIFNPPQFATFWTQCAQQGYRPKIMTPPKALLFPSAVNALGDRGTNISTEVWWSPHHPFRSGLTGQTPQQFCDAYENATGKEWTQPIGFKHASLEVAVNALKRAKKLEAGAIRDALATTDYESLVGHITWKGGPQNPVKNVCTTPLVGGQWRPGKRFKYDLTIVYNKSAPEIPLGGKFEAIKY
jgi:branched-chain amino acid transport system substrate-binding protein